MKKILYTLGVIAAIFIMLPMLKAVSLPEPNAISFKNLKYSITTDTFPMKDRKGDFITEKSKNPFDIKPNVLEQKVEYDPATGKYIIFEKIGNEYYRTPTYMTFEEYLDFKSAEQEREYFKNLAGIQANRKSATGKIDPMSKIDVQKSLIDRLFGGSEINVKPQGGIDLTLGFFTYYRSAGVFATGGNTSPWNPLDPIDLKPRLTVNGNVGTKMKLDFNYDASSSFNFDQQIKLKYDSEQFSEDDIVKKIEAGNVSLPLKGTLIQGAQSLMGLKTDLQFGHLRMTLLASQQLSKQNNIKVENGASIQEFEITPDNYDENRHFFLSHYSRETYEKSLERIPFVSSSFRVAQIQVWISDDRQDYQVGQSNIAAIADLAEGDITKYGNEQAKLSFPPRFTIPTTLRGVDGKVLPDNKVNPIYEALLETDTTSNLEYAAIVLKNQFKLKQAVDFETFRGRLLSPSEYTYNPQLGYISLNTRLRPDQRLGVAYNYFYTQNCDSVYTVGQLSGQANVISSETGPNPNQQQQGLDTIKSDKVIFLKLLKSSNQQTTHPTFDLMMKNVYRPGYATQLSKEGFQFDIYYKDDFADGSLKKFIPDFPTRPLLNIFKLDTLNRFGDPQSDGVFDYIPGLTVNERTGSIIFPVLEPFGSSLEKLIKDSTLRAKYVYNELYDTSVVIANQKFLKKNKFIMVGKVKSSNSGEINLGPFVPRNGVRVTAGGITLIENVDYEIDYSLGKLRVLNPAYISQGTPINVSFEDQSAFSTLNKSMAGARFDYDFSKKFTMGATYLRLWERPFTQKVNYGDDPINNRIFGLDMNYSDKAPWITNLLDKLPFYSTKAESSFNFTAEAAYLKPGHSKYINSSQEGKDEGGLIFLDDFEGALSGFSLGSNLNSWILSSTPPEFQESKLDNNLTYGANRAKIAWYQIDQSVNRGDNKNINRPYSRLLNQRDLFNPQSQNIGNNQIFTFDISYYPTERGPYNFDKIGGIPGFTDGTDVIDGKIRLRRPETRWGGLMRYFQNTDFETNNYQFIEFWVLNPFMDTLGNSVINKEDGEMVFHLGNVSEDVLKDNFQFFENGLPSKDNKTDLRKTKWGLVPTKVPLVNGFGLEEIAEQDLGFDGMNDIQERIHYSDWLADYNLPSLNLDPSGDNFQFYNDKALEGLDMVERMKNFSGPEGNTPEQSDFSNDNPSITGGTGRFYRGSRTPDSEDLNNNRSLDQGEAYYEYRIKFKNAGGEIDTFATPYFKQLRTIKRTGNQEEKWYRFVVPLNRPTRSVDIQGFRSIQFMRMFFTNFESQKTFRFAEFQLVRNQWRESEATCGKDKPKPTFSIDEVSLEENSTKTPFNYVRAPGLQLERLTSNIGATGFSDEKSLVMNFCNLGQGCEVGINKIANVELTLLKKLQLFAHLEPSLGTQIENGQLALFIKLGKDLENNYYEYQMPIQVSDPDGIKDNAKVVWPDTNKLDIILSKFIDTKKAKISSSGAITMIEDDLNTGARYFIKGTPSLGEVKIIEIGLRNLSDEEVYLCGSAWINELRAVGLNENGAYAAISKAQFKLADLGDINAAASYSSIGFGNLDQRLLERSRDEIVQFDASTSLALGKLLPKFIPINLPFFAQYTKSTKTPQFDPFQEDIGTRALAAVTPDAKERESVLERGPERTTIKSYNFTNVRKEGGKGGKPWSLENLSGTYSYTETKKTDPIISEDVAEEKKTSLDYGYAGKPKYIQPLKFIKPKALKLFSEFNFNPLPSSFGFNTNIERFQAYKLFRLPDIPVFRFDDKRIKWDRNYNLDWDFSKALRMNFKANVTSVVDELRQVGIRDNIEDRPWVNARGSAASADTIDQYRNNNYKNFGRAKNYTHNLSLNYKLPISLLPLMDWVNSSAEYKSSYGWTAGPLIFIDDLQNQPGNIIQNNQVRSLNANFSFDKLYSKWGYLKKIESGSKSKTKKDKKDKSASDIGGDLGGRGDKNKDGMQQDQSPADKDAASGANKDKKDKKKEKDKDRAPSMVERVLIRPLLVVRSVKFNYKEEFNTLIPGFMPESSLFGLSEGFTSPGWQFAAGLQPDLSRGNERNFLRKNQNWFNPSVAFNEQLSQSSRQNINLKVALEPFKDFKVDVDFNKDFRTTHTEIFKNKGGAQNLDYMQITALDNGSYETTYGSYNTLFTDSEKLIAQYKANRVIVADRLAGALSPRHPDYPKFPKGYGPGSFDVVVPSFISAYSGMEAGKVDTDLTSSMKSLTYIPKPNWQLRYDGLSKLPWFKDFLTSFSLKHGYKSSLSVANFNSGVKYLAENPFSLDEKNNYYSRIEIPTVMMKEDFSPLIGIDLKTKSGMEIKFEYKKGRTLDLRAANSELMETLNEGMVFGYGYVIDNFKGFGTSRPKKRSTKKKKDEFDVSGKDDLEEKEEDKSATASAADPKDKKGKGKKKSSKDDASAKGKKLTINCDFSYRDEEGTNYSLSSDDVSGQKIRGQKSYQFNPTVEYQMYKNLAIRFYFEYQKNSPYTRGAYESVNMSAGTVVRYMFN